MIYKFSFDVKAITLNHCRKINARGRNVIVTKTEEYRQLEHQIEYYCLRDFKDKIEEFNREFDKNAHYLAVEWVFHTPFLFKKNNTKKEKIMPINLTSGDLSNMIKPIEDCIFKMLTSANDAHVTDMFVSKKYSNEFKVDFSIKILNISDMNANKIMGELILG